MWASGSWEEITVFGSVNKRHMVERMILLNGCNLYDKKGDGSDRIKREERRERA